MTKKTLFSTFQLGALELPNRAVMAPMTRSRAIGNIPNELMAEYYAARAEAERVEGVRAGAGREEAGRQQRAGGQEARRSGAASPDASGAAHR